jgi:hypothetical protein
MVRSVGLSNEGVQQMIVMGADTHKRDHTLVAVDGHTGVVEGQREIPASDAGALDALRFAAGMQDERVWATKTVGTAPRALRPRRSPLASGWSAWRPR